MIVRWDGTQFFCGKLSAVSDDGKLSKVSDDDEQCFRTGFGATQELVFLKLVIVLYLGTHLPNKIAICYESSFITHFDNFFILNFAILYNDYTNNSTMMIAPKFLLPSVAQIAYTTRSVA